MWFLIGLLWAAASVIVIAPLIDEIEMLDTTSQKVFSYIILVVIAPAVIAVGYGTDALERMGIDIEEDNDDKDLWG